MHNACMLLFILNQITQQNSSVPLTYVQPPSFQPAGVSLPMQMVCFQSTATNAFHLADSFGTP